MGKIIGILTASLSIAVILKNGWNISYQDLYEELFKNFDNSIGDLFSPFENIIDLFSEIFELNLVLYEESKYIFTIIMLKATSDFKIDFSRADGRRLTSFIEMALGVISAFFAIIVGAYLQSSATSANALVSISLGIFLYEFIKSFWVGIMHLPDSRSGTIENILYYQLYFTAAFSLLGFISVLFAWLLESYGLPGPGMFALLLYIFLLGVYHFYLGFETIPAIKKMSLSEFFSFVKSSARFDMGLSLILIVLNAVLITIAALLTNGST